MPIFEYRAYDESGGNRVGIVDADTPAAARLKLRADRVHVYEIEELKDGKGSDGKKAKKIRLRRGAHTELAIVTRQFATLLNAGIPVVDALKALIDQVESRDIEQVFRDVREKVTQGQTIGLLFFIFSILQNNKAALLSERSIKANQSSRAGK